jgi:Restriction endonuclease BglII
MSAPIPSGYAFRNINYGMELLVHAFPDHCASLVRALENWTVSWPEIEAGGGNKSAVSRHFDEAFEGEGWAETALELETRLAGVTTIARTHKIDLFKRGPNEELPGVGIELEWNNKDEFFDRDLINFEAIHRARGLAVGVIMTRGPSLQVEMRVRGLKKFGARSTHWEKLMPRLELGRGGATPIVALGIEAERVLPG